MTCSRRKKAIFCFPFRSPAAMETTTDLAIDFTENIASYMREKFLHKIQGHGHNIPFPSDWDFTLLQECDHAVGVLVEAYFNPCMNIQSIPHKINFLNLIFR